MNIYQTFFNGGAQVGCPECQAYLQQQQQQQQQHQQHHSPRPPGQYLLPCGHFAVDNNTFDFVHPNQSQHNHSNPGELSTRFSTLCIATPNDQQHFISYSSSGDFGVPVAQNQFSPSLYMIINDSNTVQPPVLCGDPAASSYQFFTACLPYGSQPLPPQQLLPTSHQPEVSLPNASSSVSPLSQLPMLTAPAPESNQGSENYRQRFMNNTDSMFPMNGMAINAMTVAQSSAALIQAEHSVVKAGCAVAQRYNNISNLPYTHHTTTAPETRTSPPLLVYEAPQTPPDIHMCLSAPTRTSSTIPPLVASHTPRTSLGVNQLSPLVSMSSSDGAVNSASFRSLHSDLPVQPPYSFAPFTRPAPLAISTEASAAQSHHSKRNSDTYCFGLTTRHIPLLSSDAGTYAVPLSRNLNIPASLTTFPIVSFPRGRGPSSSLAPSTSASSSRSDITFTSNTTPKTFGKKNINSGISYVQKVQDQVQQENHCPFPRTAFSQTQFTRQSSAPLTSPPTKRLCNSYMLYRKYTFAKNRAYFKQSGASGAAISREIAHRWNQEPESVKRLFELQAEMERHRVLQAFPDYKYKKRGPQKIKNTNRKMAGGTGAESATKQKSKSSGAVLNKTSSCEGVKQANDGAQKAVLATPPRIALSI